MSETSGAGAKKTKTKIKPVRPGLRGWDASHDGSLLSRLVAYASPAEAEKGARRALSAFQKAEKALELRLEGSQLTLRVNAIAGQVDTEMKKLVKRLVPKDEAEVAKRAAKASEKAAAKAPAEKSKTSKA
jgi:hypothetical protein